jgi:excisionase family DNA binding protein
MNDKIGLTIHDVTKTTGIGRTTLFALIRDGKLPARKIGARTIVLADDLKRFLETLPKAGHRAA